MERARRRRRPTTKQSRKGGGGGGRKKRRRDAVFVADVVRIVVASLIGRTRVGGLAQAEVQTEGRVRNEPEQEPASVPTDRLLRGSRRRQQPGQPA